MSLTLMKFIGAGFLYASMFYLVIASPGTISALEMIYIGMVGGGLTALGVHTVTTGGFTTPKQPTQT